MNSNADSAFSLAASIGSPWNQGRSIVPLVPKTSPPLPQKLCQYATANRSWSSMRLPSTLRSFWYQR